MNKEMKYTSENLFDIKNLRNGIECQVREHNIQKKEYWMQKLNHYRRSLMH